MTELEDDIEVLYGKVNKLDTRMTEIEATRPFLQQMIERNIASNEKLADTLSCVEKTMIELNDKVVTQSASIENIKEEIAKANLATEKTNQRLAEIEEKTKFDILLFLKTNWPWILVCLGVGTLYASHYVKF